MSEPNIRSLTRRSVLKASAAAAAATGLTLPGLARAQGTRSTDTVRLTYGRGGLPLLAKERGEFEKRLAAEDIQVQWVGPFPNHAPSLQAVVGGSADFGFWGSSTPAMAAIIAGSPLVFTSFNLYNPRSTAIIVKNQSGIASVEDLVGKSVAVNRSGLGEFLLVAALEKNGIQRDQVDFVYLNPPDAAPAFGQGKVDAWSMWTPGVDIARDQFDGRNIFFEGTDLDFAIDFGSLLTTRTFAEQNSEVIRSVIDAYRVESDWVSAHPVEAETFAQKEAKYSDSVRDYLISLARKYQTFDAGDPEFIAKFQFAVDWLSDRQILPAKVTVTDYIVKI